MAISKKSVFKLILAPLIIMFAVLGVNVNIQLLSILTLISSAVLLVKTSHNVSVFVAALFIFYCNYSIVIGEYIVGGNLGIPLTTVKTPEIYGMLIRIMFLFISLIALFYKPEKTKLVNIDLNIKKNSVIFWALIVFLIYIFMTGNLGQSGSSVYTVRITPLYEYSTLIFLMAYYYSGKNKYSLLALTSLATLFILQDFYTGGRITSIQLAILLAITVFRKLLSIKNIVLAALVGLVVVSMVGAFRSDFSMDAIDMSSIIERLTESYLVFDTPVYAYYASATHIAATPLVSWGLRGLSLLAFVGAIFVGEFTTLSNVTSFVDQNFYINVGGGVLPSHMYFWFGWSGIIIIALLICWLLSRLNRMNNDFRKLVLITIIVTVPRWYLYSPLLLFRPIVLLFIMYSLLYISHKIMVSTVY